MATNEPGTPQPHRVGYENRPGEPLYYWRYDGRNVQAQVEVHLFVTHYAERVLMDKAKVLDVAAGSGALSKALLDKGFDVACTSWNAQVDLNWPLFDASQTKLQVKQSHSFLRNAQRNYQNDIRQLRVNVENAYLDLKRIENQINNFSEEKTAADKNVQSIRSQFKNGISRLTDVFDSEDNLRSLELEYLDLLVSFNQARDRLKVLLGMDLDKI